MFSIPPRWLKRIFSYFSTPKRRPPRPHQPIALEELEPRNLPAGTWTPLTNLAPAGIGTMMLLSDGTVMAQEGGSEKWDKLTPDAVGSYVNGTWSNLASMSTQRLYYGSNILPDGRVFLVGGEYSGPGLPQNFNNTGEIYDPIANAWTPITDFPQTQFGDDPTQVLPNGTVLAGYLAGPDTFIYDPAADTWTATGTKLRNDQSDEEAWVKLPDQSILSYDVFGSGTTVPGHAQRYIPSTGTWVDAGSVPVSLSSSAVGFELGPAFRLPDGRILQLGGNSSTAIYTPSTNTWVTGPLIPDGMGADDAPGAILPNGDLIFFGDVPLFGPVTNVFDFNYLNNTISQVTTPAALTAALDQSAFNDRTLVLPNGQMLLSTGADQLWVYTPIGSPKNSWRPTIASIINNNNGTFTLKGTQLNGISEGAAYGDDVEMSSNYPIIRFTLSNGQVFYGRTSNWSSTGVATGNTPEFTLFTMPAGVTGSYFVTVIANGIASLSLVQGSAVKVFYPVRYARVSSTVFSGNLTLVNMSVLTISGPCYVLFPAFPNGISLANRAGTMNGKPYVTVSGTMASHGSLHVFYELNDPLHAALTTFFFGFPVQIFVSLS